MASAAVAASALGPDEAVIWEPQSGPQRQLIKCPVFEIFFGGARGGGKTDGMLGDWIAHSNRYGADAIGLMVRRTREELSETIERARAIYTPLGFKFVDNVVKAPNKARLRFAYLERDADAEAYQGHSYSRVYVEEIGNFPSPAPVMKLMATLRSGAGVRVGFRATGNPGGPGHQWVKARYIDPAPLGWDIITDAKSGLRRVYIPSRLSDNQKLIASDPGYINRLRIAGNETLVRAWLEGDWSVVTGAYFPEFSIERHVIEPRELPAHWARFRAMDWGSARPFSVGWYAVSDGTVPGIAKGTIVKYREWYGASEPNVGLKLTAEQVADGIADRERGDKIVYGVLDPAAFSRDGGPSIAERMGVAQRGVWFRPADNARVGQRGAMGGWDQLRQRLIGDDGPGILFFSTCRDTIRTLPALQHDDARPEDVDTDGEDHAADETRYACMSRPFIRAVATKEPGRVLYGTDRTSGIGQRGAVTIDDMWKAHGQRRETRI